MRDIILRHASRSHAGLHIAYQFPYLVVTEHSPPIALFRFDARGAAPGQEHWVIRQNHKTGERSLDRLWSGLIPYWSKQAGRRPINAKAETVASLPMFRDAYKLRRCIVPIDNFFEWKAIKGAKAKQPMPSP